MTTEAQKEAPKKTTKRKASEINKQLVPTEEGIKFAQLFEWKTHKYLPVWNHVGLGISTFYGCILKKDVNPHKKGDHFYSISFNFASSVVEFQKTDDPNDVTCGEIIIGLRDIRHVSYKNISNSDSNKDH